MYAKFARLFWFSISLREDSKLGTTKLTRKEILAEDPVHAAMIHMVELFRAHGTKIIAGAALALIIALGIYWGIWYLGRRDVEAGQMLAKGIDFFHAQVAPDAADDPFAKGGTPQFRTDAAKYEAAKKEFASIVSDYSRSGVSSIANYYLGLTQLKLGQTNEAVQALEKVGAGSSNPTVAALAKMALANHYAETGNNQRAQGLLEELMKTAEVEGQAIGIGHPRSATLQVLKEELGYLLNKYQVEIVPVTELLHNPNEN